MCILSLTLSTFLFVIDSKGVCCALIDFKELCYLVTPRPSVATFLLPLPSNEESEYHCFLMSFPLLPLTSAASPLPESPLPALLLPTPASFLLSYYCFLFLPSILSPFPPLSSRLLGLDRRSSYIIAHGIRRPRANLKQFICEKYPRPPTRS